MKFFESHYDEYIKEVDNFSLHPQIKKLFTTFPKSINDLPNIIMYGPSGIGKYSHSLYLISKYSQSNMKYEKRIAVSYNKDTFFVKISDIHFEVDMSLLGCNSKHIWNEIYNQIIDIISSRYNTTAIVMCKNFHKIHSELLETFYSYMHDNEYVSLKFIIITDNVSFIPDNITQRCKTVHFKRPSIATYNKCLFGVKNKTPGSGSGHVSVSASSASLVSTPLSSSSNLSIIKGKQPVSNINSNLIVKSPPPPQCCSLYKTTIAIPNIQTTDIFQVIKKTPVRLTNSFELHKISNIKSLKANITELLVPHENICNNIIQIIKTPTTHLKFDVLRDTLYDLLIYDIDIQECIWFILERLIRDNILHIDHMNDIMIKMFTFLQYFNNNYRPIYHLENFVILLICKIHGFQHITSNVP